ncbi:MAG TPA: isocitrate dehydrogenase kinase/phosphatase AceK regulatory subunit, partial [Chloroflexia bacterium]
MADIMTTDPPTDVGKGLASACAEAIGEAFAAYHDRYHEITRQAKSRFEQCDWHGLHNDGVERLELYREVVASTVSSLEPQVQEHFGDGEFWGEVKSEYSRFILGRKDYELAETFFNSVTLRVANDGCIDAGIQYVGTEHPDNGKGAEEHAYKTYAKESTTQERVREMLLDCAFECEFRCLEEDAAQIAEAIERHLQESAQGEPVESIDIASPLFYRGKGAYLVGRVRTFTHSSPLMVCMSNGEGGVYVDAVLLTENEVSIMFSFARSYFHVNTDEPSAIVHLLKTIMPRKPVAELYTQLGYNKHGKTELYRDLVRHLQRSDDKFEIAPGERGMVMIVFTLPSYDVVFKIIKDRFDYPKSTTRQEVRNRYYL